MCSNEILAERYNNMEKQNNKEHTALGYAVTKVDEKIDKLIDKLDDTYVMRREFKVGLGFIGVFATVLGIVGFFIK